MASTNSLLAIQSRLLLWKYNIRSSPHLTPVIENFGWSFLSAVGKQKTQFSRTHISGEPMTQLRSRLFRPPRLSSRSSFSSLRLRLVGGGVFLSSWMESRSMLLYTCVQQKILLCRENQLTGPFLSKGENLLLKFPPESLNLVTFFDQITQCRCDRLKVCQGGKEKDPASETLKCFSTTMPLL